jgi:hypothetical protein
VAGLTGIYAILTTVYALNYGTSDYWVNLLPVIMVLAMWNSVAFWWLIIRMVRRWHRVSCVSLVAVLSLPLALLVTQWPAMDASEDREAQAFVEEVLATCEPDALVFARGDQRIFALWYAAYVLADREDVVPILHIFLHWPWYRASLAQHHEGLDLREEGLGATALEVMIERHLPRRPIYLTWEDEETAKAYQLVRRGPVWRVMPPAH